MAQIGDGLQYALRSQHQSRAGKGCSVVLVKLTDSMIKSIEDYVTAVQKGAISPSAKPSIKIDSDSGVIQIPGKDASSPASPPSTVQHRFNYALKDIQNDGILHAVQHNTPEQMDVLGRIMSRMQIQAGEESFENMKIKISHAVKQEQSKYNTKPLGDYRTKQKSLTPSTVPPKRPRLENGSNCYKNAAAMRQTNGNSLPASVVNSLKSSTGNGPTNGRPSSGGNNGNRRTSGNGSGSINSTPNSSPDSGISHIGKAGSDDETDEFSGRYPKIMHVQQLLAYREDFYRSYEEYKKLSTYTEDVNKDFESLRQRLRQLSEGSTEYNEMVLKIIEKYEKAQAKDGHYMMAEKRINYLNKKMNFIKKCCIEYMESNPGQDVISVIKQRPAVRQHV